MGLTTGTAFAQSQPNDIVVINGERYRVYPEVDCSTERQYFPNESDGGSFYQCSNGVPIYQPCPNTARLTPVETLHVTSLQGF
jgi:Chitin binding Peritrophin-A domain